MSTPTLMPSPPAVQPPRVKHAAAPPLPFWRIAMSIVAGTVAFLLLWTVGYLSIFSAVQQDRSQHELYGTFRSQLAQGVLPIGGSISPGQAIALIQLPKAGLDKEVVVEGSTSGDLRAGPGHVPTTPLPGQLGNSVILGRSLAFGGPFAGLNRLAPGDRFTVTTGQGAFHYKVLDLRQAGDLIPPALFQIPSSLTLITRVGGWSAGHVLYVDSVLTNNPTGAPAGRPTALAPGEGINQGQTDQLTLVQIVLWLQLLVVIACGLAWIATKWGRWQIWLVGMPIVLTVLWGLSNTAVRLLPNLL